MNYYYPYGENPQSSYYQLGSEDYGLKIRQQPKDALLAQDGKEKNRKPVDPPPIIEVTVREGADPIRQYLQSPYLFMCCSLVPPTGTVDDPAQGDERALCGTMVSSLHKLKDIDNRDGGFFVFGDVSVKRVGEHRLLFSLFELQKDTLQVVYLQSVLSDTFIVHPQKEYPGLEESTHLSRTFADQGVKLRLRKEARTMGGSSNRKRSYPYSSQAQPQAGPSRTSLTAQESGSYGSSVSGSYGEYSETGSKRHRSGDSGQYSSYGTPVQQSAPFTVPSSVYQQQQPQQQSGSRLPTQAPVPSQPPSSAQSRWPNFYGPGNSPGATPGATSDFNYRSTSFPRLDLAGSNSQQPPSSLNLPGYERGGHMGYGGQQQMYSNLPQLPASTAGTPSTYPQQQPQPYSNIPESGYASYTQTPQYRSDQGYGTLPRDPASSVASLHSQQSIGQGLSQIQPPYAAQGQGQQGYGEEGQGYQNSYDSQGRTQYPPSSRTW